MENETGTQQQEPQADPKPEPTVNLHKFERMQERAEQAEARLAELKQQMEEAATKEGDKDATIKAMKEAAEKAAEETAQKVADYEAKIKAAETTNALLSAGCIDAESGLASLQEGETVEALKERKPHLFKQPTKPSGGEPKEGSITPEAQRYMDAAKRLGVKPKGL